MAAEFSMEGATNANWQQTGQPGLTSGQAFYFVLDSSNFEAMLARMRKELGSESTAQPLYMVAYGLLSRIIAKTPVWTGELRSAWYYSLSKLAQRMNGLTKGAPRFGTKAEKYGYTNEGAFEVSSSRTSKVVTMINKVPHAMMCEYGWSKKSPFGMVRISIQEMLGAFPPLIKTQLEYMWHNAGVPPGTSWYSSVWGGIIFGNYYYVRPTLDRGVVRWRRRS